MPCNYPLVEKRFKLPETLINEYKIVSTDKDGREHIIHENHSHQRFAKHVVDWEVVSVKLLSLSTLGVKKFRVFGFEEADSAKIDFLWRRGLELVKRKRLRREGYDYSQNSAYFITVCIKSREHVLGQVVGFGILDEPKAALPGKGKKN